MKDAENTSAEGNIIYNVTVKVENHIADDWLQWLLNKHIPAIMQTGCFLNYKVVRLLEVDDSEGPTYAIQYYAGSKTDYNRYMQLYAASFRNDSYANWGEQFIAFHSIMEIVK